MQRLASGSETGHWHLRLWDEVADEVNQRATFWRVGGLPDPCDHSYRDPPSSGLQGPGACSGRTLFCCWVDLNAVKHAPNILI